MKRPAIICDIDGTLADMGKGIEGKRGPYDWDRVDEDGPKLDVIKMVQLLLYGRSHLTQSPFSNPSNIFTMIFVTGRKEQCRGKTWNWLYGHGLNFGPGVSEGILLLMRPDDDNRPDYEFKEDIYLNYIKPTYDVMFVIDDRNSVVKMWRSHGLTVAQVAEGDF